MVDSINKISGIQTTTPVGVRPQDERKDADQARASGFNTADEVSISSEASELSQIQQQTASARQALEDNKDIALGRSDAVQDFLV